MFGTHDLGHGATLRDLRVEDAAALSHAYVRNRTHLAPWEPIRPEEYFTESWQAMDLARRSREADAGLAYSLGMFAEDTIVGRLNVGGITRGPFQSAGIGYWVDHEVAGRGLASSAVELVVAHSRTKLKLHRLEASTLTHNLRSQRVLEKTGFQQIGMAPKYLQIAGEWQNHNLYQAILHD